MLASRMAAAHLASYGVSRTLIYEWMKSGKLASVKLGGARLIPVDALEALLGGTSK
jgi:excisionase family DNA binding protein